MGVFIKLVENRPPQEYADPSAVDVTFDDVTKGVSQVTYEYDVLPSGALRILRVAKGEAPVVDTTYAPGLWFRVTGQWSGTWE
ncbi:MULTISPECIES: hypothetical protein [Streptomyces]|uniref:Uncharacterized protein n=1 Tax=Streptomyces celluloflavus TaxID=58344 RepID=A0ABW7RGP4_9ACTN|nr:hypothetical protein [Streptomyces kasugaensis]MYU53455.1 hypothetical protein [Streptomyces sp. SID7805]WSK13887.1 hypothetical protein OG717_20235 [Streptomyces celluloflavus]